MEVHPLRSETDFVFVRSCRHVAGDRVDQTAVSTGVDFGLPVKACQSVSKRVKAVVPSRKLT